MRKASAKYRLSNREKELERQKSWRDQNKERISDYNKSYREDNIAADREKSARRRFLRKRAVPKWLTEKQRDELREIYQIAMKRGDAVQVDHIIPLNGEDVCGLHVPWNLRIISAAENLAKRNKLPPKEDWIACPA